MPYKLICFDVDNTLTDFNSDDLRPQAEAHLNTLKSNHIALITNQGGPACRDAEWPWSEKYPTMAEVNARLGWIAKQVKKLTGILPAAFVSWAYITKNDQVLFPKDLPDDLRDVTLRKPSPAMLLKAMRHYDCQPSDVLMIGDGVEDAEAAKAAEVDFMWVEKAFSGSGQ